MTEAVRRIGLRALGLALVAMTVLAGCGSSDAPGWDSESKAAAEALNKAGNDISKLTPEQRRALERAAGDVSHRGMQTSPGGATTLGGTAPTGSTGR